MEGSGLVEAMFLPRYEVNPDNKNGIMAIENNQALVQHTSFASMLGRVIGLLQYVGLIGNIMRVAPSMGRAGIINLAVADVLQSAVNIAVLMRTSLVPNPEESEPLFHAQNFGCDFLAWFRLYTGSSSNHFSTAMAVIQRVAPSMGRAGIINLAVADVLQSAVNIAVLMRTSLVPNPEESEPLFHAQNFGCDFLAWFRLYTGSSSNHFSTAMAVIQTIAIVKVSKGGHPRPANWKGITFGLVWLINLAITLPPLVKLWGAFTYFQDIGHCYISFDADDSKTQLDWGYIIFFMLTQYICPIAVLVACYVTTFCTIYCNSHMRTLSRKRSGVEEEEENQDRSIMIKTFFALTLFHYTMYEYPSSLTGGSVRHHSVEVYVTPGTSRDADDEASVGAGSHTSPDPSPARSMPNGRASPVGPTFVREGRPPSALTNGGPAMTPIPRVNARKNPLPDL
uniref:G-protein coupled receptors family 1 profile domain-containing protein n=1 Tax=Branchiostoma floridae TaxID=7739 RepID=C3Z1C8_BRAFL|eukprot:XP_002597657.1 hypothetical protein BRAFLDRAFT_77457 [Branchiostoma floridae]